MLKECMKRLKEDILGDNHLFNSTSPTSTTTSATTLLPALPPPLSPLLSQDLVIFISMALVCLLL